jgi:hypothetical protein
MSVVYINEYVPPVGMFLNKSFTTNCNPDRIPPLPIINSPTRNIKETFETGSSTEQNVGGIVADEVRNTGDNEVGNSVSNENENPVTNEVENPVANETTEKIIVNETEGATTEKIIVNETETESATPEKTEPFVNKNIITNNNIIREPVNTNNGNFYPMGENYSHHIDRDLKDLVRAIENERFYRYFESVNKYPVTKNVYIPKTSSTKSENNSMNIILICSAIIIAALLLRK